MHYTIRHQTQYFYSSPVMLDRHILRLCPRSDGSQGLQQFSLLVEPAPLGQTHCLDAEGNTIVQVWFDSTPTKYLQITTHCEVETTRPNPFDYLIEPWATQALPWDYPQSLAVQLQMYLQSSGHPPGLQGESPAVIEFAQELLWAVEGDVGSFLIQLNQAIGQHCQYQARTQGKPWPPGLTLKKQMGSCRDFSVLFMAACRAVGLAARFVSGYQEGDPNQTHRDLHAWVEVYVPGGGWRGFDPTLGLAVSDRHVALAASAFPAQTTPISGQFRSGSFGTATSEPPFQSQFKTQIELLQHP